MKIQPSKYYFIINPHCRQGNGFARWKEIRSQLLPKYQPCFEIISHNLADLSNQLIPLINSDDSLVFISAGGDGSLHQLCNLLLSSGKSHQHMVGAIGLGSSNDFLKPFRQQLNGIPIMINANLPPVFHDAGKIIYTDTGGKIREKFFMINSSFGVTARGNWYFNNPDWFLKQLKRKHTSSAILYTSIKTILTHRNNWVNIACQGQSEFVLMSNINILKKKFISGNLHYPQDIQLCDGQLGFHICQDLKKTDLVKTLLDLEKGIFKEDKNKRSSKLDAFELTSSTPIVIEYDGETDFTTHAKYSVIPNAIQFLNH
jgi:diacylglycerol kinase (ATP)